MSWLRQVVQEDMGHERYRIVRGRAERQYAECGGGISRPQNYFVPRFVKKVYRVWMEYLDGKEDEFRGRSEDFQRRRVA